MEGPKTFSYSTNSNINCFALNSSANRVIVAEPNELELLTIGEEKFYCNHICNIASKHLRIMDISWSRMDESLVACGCSTGEIHRLQVTPSDVRLNGYYHYHDRTINKISFHPNNPNLLLSGGQDGLVYLIDIRAPNEKRAFKHDSEDRVTDVQFNPACDMENQFASGSHNGIVYLWDIGYPDKRYEKKITAHMNMVVHLDWHPDEKNWLATGSLDKQIHVWDTASIRNSDNSSIKYYTDKQQAAGAVAAAAAASAPAPIFSLTHSETVQSIKWRPKHKTQITACSTQFDAHLYVWDFKRPYVPYVSFDFLTNKVKNFMWRNSPYYLIASTRQVLYSTHISEAVKPAENSVTVQMDKYGSIAFSVSIEGDENELFLSATDHHKVSIDSATRGDTSDDSLERVRMTKSLLYFNDQTTISRCDWFYYSATNYKFKTDLYDPNSNENSNASNEILAKKKNKSFEQLCDHNAQVAYDFKKFDICKNWKILKIMYKESESVSNDYNENESESPLNILNIDEVDNPMPFYAQTNLNTNVSSSSATTSANNSTNFSMQNSSSDFLSDESPPNIDSVGHKILKNDKLSGLYAASNVDLYGGGFSLIQENDSSLNHHHRHHHNHSTNMNNQSDFLLKNQNTAEAKSEQQQQQHHRSLKNSEIINESSTSQIISEDRWQTLANRHDDIDTLLLAPSDVYDNNYGTSDEIDFFSFLSVNKKESNDTLLQKENTTYNFFSNSANVKKNSPDFNFLLTTTKAAKSRIKNSNSMADSANKSNLGDQTATQQNEASSMSNNKNYQNKPNDSVTEKFLDFSNMNLNQFSSANFSKMNFDTFFHDLLLYYINDENDLSTAIFMFLVAALHGKIDKSRIEKVHLDEWFSQYIELLAQFELWNRRVEILKAYQSDFLNSLTQKSLTYSAMCAACKKSIQTNTNVCISCNKNVFLCSYCRMPVKKLYAWCHACCHGGHLKHMMKWFTNNTKCPTGCGCSCVLTQI